MRKKLPDTRTSQTVKVETATMEAYIIVGFYDNNQPGEVFIKIAKEGSFLRGALDIIAIEASLLLQYGIPARVVAEKWQHTKFDQSEIFDALALALIKSVSVMGGSIDHGHCGPDGGMSGGGVPDPRPDPAPALDSGVVQPSQL